MNEDLIFREELLCSSSSRRWFTNFGGTVRYVILSEAKNLVAHGRMRFFLAKG